MPIRQEKSYCRICCAHCGLIVAVDDERNEIVGVKPDKANPHSEGHSCFKGLQAAEAHHGPARLLRSLKRQSDGSYVEIHSERALDEIADKLQVILTRGGPNAVASFKGTQGTLFATNRLQISFLEAIGSEQYFTTHTVDQSCKSVSFERQGAWAAGLQDLSQSDVLLFFGANPLISHSTMPVMSPNPKRMLKQAKTRGMKVICVDPRRSETAHYADVFLQPLPGCDAAIVAAMIRIILAEGWEDRDFVQQHVGDDRIAALRAAVELFMPERVERHADLKLGQLRQAAKLFAYDCKRGAAYAATGTSMSAFSNLTQHLVDTLNIICGRFRRVGDKAVVDMISPTREFRAEVIPPLRSWENIPASRIRGVGRLGMDRLASTIPEEILTPGPGQIRAMIVHGANPAVCLPDQQKVVEALKALELLVVVDPYLSATGKLAHYVLAPTMMYERPDLPYTSASFPVYPRTWTQYTGALLPRPAGSDLIEDWYIYWAVAKRLGLQLHFFGKPIDMETPPTTDELLSIRLETTPISLEELKQDLLTHPSGKFYDPPSAIVLPARPEANGRFDPMPSDVMGEMEELQATIGRQQIQCEFPHMLITRRMNGVMNSTGLMLEGTLRRMPYNPAYLAPEELHALDLTGGDKVEIATRHGRIETWVQPDKNLRRGVVSIAHCWGGLDANAPGANVNLLIPCDNDVQSINAMPRMSAVPVRITKLASTDQTHSHFQPAMFE